MEIIHLSEEQKGGTFQEDKKIKNHILRDESEIKIIIFQNILDMLKDRFYFEEKQEHKILELYSDRYKKKMNETIFHINKSDVKIDKELYILMIEDNNTLKNRDILKIINEKENKVILVLNNNIVLNKVHMKKLNLENVNIFYKKFFYTNITKHILVPKYKLLNEEEKKIYFEKYNINPKLLKTTLPRINFDDQIVSYFDAKKGDVFKVEFPSETTKYKFKLEIVI